MAAACRRAKARDLGGVVDAGCCAFQSEHHPQLPAPPAPHGAVLSDADEGGERPDSRRSAQPGARRCQGETPGGRAGGRDAGGASSTADTVDVTELLHGGLVSGNVLYENIPAKIYLMKLSLQRYTDIIKILKLDYCTLQQSI